MNDNDGQPQAAALAAVVSVKLPDFWKTDPVMWFAQAESQFTLARVTSDETKFHHIVAKVDQSVICHIADLVTAPPVTNKYDTVKKRLIDRFALSPENRLERLLGSHDLGDLRPTHLLSKMQELSTGLGVDDSLLKMMFIQRLQSSIRSIISCHDGTLAKLAEMADKIVDTVGGQASVVTNVSKKSVCSVENNLKSEIDFLTAEIRKLKSSGRSRMSTAMLVQFKKLASSQPVSAEVGGVHDGRRLVIYDRTTNYRFLIDTGSDVSILPATRQEKNGTLAAHSLHAANGTKITTYGTKFLNTDLGLRRRFLWNFIIADVTIPIIGADFIAHFGILVDLKHQRFLDGRTGLCSSGNMTSPDLYNVTTVNSDHPYRDLLSEFREITLPSTMQSEI
ncbi:uncharacterized protein LOC131428853 [Malaya genurostris]|uniref:uncharacterized protein LOC131428853 n=1 Tax=Malaya genurostris TaxID=325434 RepID=UPI0026F38181|nr:uncharacterized protein LOC131428853 [Malaya genurostris]